MPENFDELPVLLVHVSLPSRVGVPVSGRCVSHSVPESSPPPTPKGSIRHWSERGVGMFRPKGHGHVWGSKDVGVGRPCTPRPSLSYPPPRGS